jgi:uncharacterized Fe-S cluster-containing MiaB family protein
LKGEGMILKDFLNLIKDISLEADINIWTSNKCECNKAWDAILNIKKVETHSYQDRDVVIIYPEDNEFGLEDE